MALSDSHPMDDASDKTPTEKTPRAALQLPAALAVYKAADRQSSLMLIAGFGLLTLVCATLLAGWIGALLGLLATGLLIHFGPRMPARATLRLYHAVPLDPGQSDKLYRILGLLSQRAGLAQTPRLHVIPSLMLNAFCVGVAGEAAVAVTEGLLRRLSMREIAGVLAHEIGHIKNDDLPILNLADTLTRATQLMAWLGLLLLVLEIPALAMGYAGVSWLGIILLLLAPLLANRLQLSLPRTREGEADAAAAMLTGDALGLAAALGQIAPSEGRLIEDVAPPFARKVSQPSLLRAHPAMAERIAQLRLLAERGDLPAFTTREEPMVLLAGLGPISMRARYRFSGVWF